MTNETKLPAPGQRAPKKKEEPKPEKNQTCRKSLDNKNVELITNCILLLAIAGGGFVIAYELLSALLHPCR